ncbi:MAG: hypothetical protein H6605_07175 [Flavobacteriales bacterium]|nr:hypothetical protein [Flavobacteriales bacterium]
MNKGKFVIDGAIEVENRPTPEIKSGGTKQSQLKAWLWVFVITTLVFFVLAFYFFIQIENHQTDLIDQRSRNKAIDEVVSKNKDLKQKELDLEKEIFTLKKKLGEEGEVALLEEAYFEVQIGSFVNFELTINPEEMLGLKKYSLGDTTKICLGRFRDFDRADRFRKEIVKLGFKNAVVTGKLNEKEIYTEDARKLIEDETVKK